MKQSRIGAVRTVLEKYNLSVIAKYYDRRKHDIKLKVVLSTNIGNWPIEKQDQLCNDIFEAVPNCGKVRIAPSTQGRRYFDYCRRYFDYLDISTPHITRTRKKRRRY